MCSRAKIKGPFRATARTHTSERAGVLAREWTAQMLRMYNIWRGYDGPMGLADFDREARKHTESAEFHELEQMADLPPRALNRVIQLKGIFLLEETAPPAEDEGSAGGMDEDGGSSSGTSSSSSPPSGSSSSESDHDVGAAVVKDD